MREGIKWSYVDFIDNQVQPLQQLHAIMVALAAQSV